MVPPLSYVPLLPPLVAMIIGIVAGRYHNGYDWIILSALLGTTTALVLTHRRYTAAIVLAAVVGFGAEVISNSSHGDLSGWQDAGKQEITGIVTKVSETELARKFVVDIHEPVQGICYVTVPEFSPEVAEGDIVNFVGTFEPLTSRSDIAGDINLNDFYYRNYITARVVAERSTLKNLGEADGIIWQIRRLRNKLIDSIISSNLSEQSQCLIAAILLGDDKLLSAEIRPQFMASGLAHTLALSGMHVAVVVAFLSLLFFPLVWFGHNKLRLIIVVSLLWTYAVMTGLSPSVTRAVIMFSLVILARCIGRGYSSGNALCFAAIAILIFSPRSLFSPGFQLSFIALAAMVAIPPLIDRSQHRSLIARYLIEYLTFILTAIVSTVILSAFYFNQIPVYSLISNLPCVLLLPLIIGGGILVLLLSLLGIDFNWLNACVDFFCNALTYITRGVADLPSATVNNVYIEWWGVIAFYIAITATIFFVVYKKKQAAIVTTLSAVFLLVIAWDRGNYSPILFVGRSSDATNVIITDGNRGILCSTAPEFQHSEQHERVMDRYADFFAKHGIDSLDVYKGDFFEINFRDKRLAVINSNDVPDDISHVDYVIIGRGFKGDIRNLVDHIQCDSVLLGSDIKKRRRQRYENELIDAGVKVRSLAEGYGLVLSN